jgi:hypothetical protein
VLDGVHDSVCTIGEAIGVRTQLAISFDPDHSAELVLRREPIEIRVHPGILPDVSSPCDRCRQIGGYIPAVAVR